MTEKYGRLIVDRDICTGCRSCEVACSLAHEGCFWPERARIQVYKKEEDGLDYPMVCLQCDDAACMAACPEEALERDLQTGAVLVKDACIGCGACVETCPFGAARLDEARDRAIICDLCKGEPACVQRCVVHALKYRDGAGRIVTAPVHAITLPQEKLHLKTDSNTTR
ncbi:MAG: 4Fe-4S dicluster domain-containing protein [Bacillota bacterium]